MDTKPSSSPPDRRSLYADPSIFQVAVRTTDDGWIQMTLEVDPEGTQGGHLRNTNAFAGRCQRRRIQRRACQS